MDDYGAGFANGSICGYWERGHNLIFNASFKFPHDSVVDPLTLPGVKCERYVHKSQFHCEQCNQCGDISGRRVKHCDQCNTCTVAHQPHCVKCGKCQPKEHVCRVPVKSECFTCGQTGHKQSECPSKKRKKKN